eukprot:scaffold60092_cov17-Tisochrysis_lutea.AAC.2
MNSYMLCWDAGPAEFKDSQTSRVCCCFPQGGISGSLVLPTNVAHVGSEMVIKNDVLSINCKSKEGKDMMARKGWVREGGLSIDAGQ